MENGKRIFVSECVCVCVSEFWSKNFVFGNEPLSYNQNFVFEQEFLVLLYVTGIFCLPQNFVCACLRTYFVTGILERKVFLHVKSECF